MGPNLSILQESAIAPVLGTRPNDGRNPVHPQRVDGDEIEPSVSDPMLNATHPASATAAGCVAFSIGSATLGSISSPSPRCGCRGLGAAFGLGRGPGHTEL